MIRSNQTIDRGELGSAIIREIKRPVTGRANFSTISEMLDGFEFAEHTPEVLTEHATCTFGKHALRVILAHRPGARDTVKLTVQE